MPSATAGFPPLVAVFAIFSLWPGQAYPADYLGADAVLKRLSAEAGNPTPPPPASLSGGGEAVSKKTPLPAAQTAKEWLQLVDSQRQLASTPLRDWRIPPPEGRDLLLALPPPSVWGDLKKAVEARPAPPEAKNAVSEIALRLLADTLAGDSGAFAKDLPAVREAARRENTQNSWAVDLLSRKVEENAIAGAEDADTLLASMNRQLAARQMPARTDRSQPLAIPDLVSLMGREKAADFLRRALLTPGVELETPAGAETRQLARKLALELVADLKTPPWNFAHSLDAMALYEALDARFPNPQENDAQAKRAALSYYILALAVHGRAEEAVKRVRQSKDAGSLSIDSDALSALEKAGHSRAVLGLLRELLTQDPDLPFWDDYVHLASQLGTTQEMLELVRQSVAKKTASEKTRFELGRRLVTALLAADETEEGAAQIRTLLAGEAGKPGEGEGASEAFAARGQLALQLAKLGGLLGREPWVGEGVRQARAALAELGKQDDSYSYNDLNGDLTAFLARNGRGPEAEALLSESLALELQKAKKSHRPDRFALRNKLLPLLALYHQAGREADVLELLENAPYWNAADLAGLISETTPSFEAEGRDSIPIGYLAASALAAAGKKEAARPVLEAVLDKNGGYDPAYALLLKMEGPAAAARLDTLFANDPFEERPLIWKATLLLGEGKAEEAEAVARRAIAIDPSDGEEGVDDRMRAYAVLADIREARGDTKEAAFFRQVVEAIRLSEKADRFYEAGLLSRAVGMYKEALGHFSDAYCIQSRLALRLAELGKDKEAEIHFRRAYELMPGSFGRVESHCFGCEGAFRGGQQQSVAEQVFTRLAAQTPEKPQVHYLLGYLREEQGRNSEAFANYRTAVKLDPEYLNAWKHLETVSEALLLPPAERDAIALSLLRLDPAGRHGGHSALNKVRDLKKLWETVAALKPGVSPRLPATLYPLPASKAELEKTPNALEPYREASEGPLTPARAVANQSMVSSIGNLLLDR